MWSKKGDKGFASENKTQDGDTRLRHAGTRFRGRIRSEIRISWDLRGQAFETLMTTFNFTRPGVAAQALGIAQGAFNAAVHYAKERVQFGKSLASFQGLQWMISEMALQIELARTITYRAASLIDNDPDSADIPRIASMAKWHASDTAMKVTTDAVQILGGYGYIREYPVERMMRDAKITQIYEGTNQVQRIIIAAQLLR